MFLWDEVKNRSNQQKHGISFNTAQLIFDDPLHVSRPDRYENGEERWQTIGVVGGLALLLVVHTWHESDDEAARPDIKLNTAALFRLDEQPN